VKEKRERERVFGRFGFGQPGQGVREVAWFGFFFKNKSNVSLMYNIEKA
jgi:hypothetical protein